jgi:hypothetical protein
MQRSCRSQLQMYFGSHIEGINFATVALRNSHDSMQQGEFFVCFETRELLRFFRIIAVI